MRAYRRVVLDGSKLLVVELGGEALEAARVVHVVGLDVEGRDDALHGHLALLHDDDVLVGDGLGGAAGADDGGRLIAAADRGGGEGQGEGGEDQRELHIECLVVLERKG